MLARHAVLLTLPADGNRSSWSYRYTGTLLRPISIVSHDGYDNESSLFYSSSFFSDSCALFCIPQKLNPFLFKQFRTLLQKHPGVGVPPSFPPSTFRRSDLRTFRSKLRTRRLFASFLRPTPTSCLLAGRAVVTSSHLYLVTSAFLNPLDATFMTLPARVANNRLTTGAKSFRCNTYKKHRGEGRSWSFNVSMFQPSNVSTRVSDLSPRLAPHQILNVVHLFPQQMELPPQTLNFGFGAAIHGIIQFAPHAVFPVLAVLAHHDHRRLDRRQQRQNQIQQDKRIRIPRRPPHTHVYSRVDAAQNEKANNKRPRPAELHHGIRDAVGNRRFLFDHIVRVAHRTHAHQLLRSVKLLPQHRQHIHSRVRLALQQRRNIPSADFQALRIFHGRSVGLMRRLLQHRCETKELAMRRFIHH